MVKIMIYYPSSITNHYTQKYQPNLTVAITNGRIMNIKLYGVTTCPYTQRLITLLNSLNIQYQWIDATNMRDELRIKSGHRTVPQLFCNDVRIGDCDTCHQLQAAGQLLPKLL
jgi:glutaredoxin 3